MKTRTLTIFIGISALAAAGGCVARSAVSTTPQQAALVRATCENIMRVGHSEVDIAACTESLSESLAARAQGYAAVESDRACSRQGLAPGTAQFATCVLDRSRHYAGSSSSAANSAAPQLTYDPGKDTGASEDYYDASFDTKRRREEYSCAQLGLDPNSGAFGQCVASLDANLFNADHPDL